MYVNYNNNSDSMVQPIGKRKPIAGIFDLFGNAYELCNDWYGVDYYKMSRGDNPQGPDVGEKKVLRGGSIFNTKTDDVFEPWRRHSINPAIKWDSDSLKADVGFRCAKNF